MATASIVAVWQRVMDLAKAGTSGQDTEAEFNGKTDSVQKALQEMLIDVAEINQKASDALSWLKVSSGNLTSNSTGQITLPNDYLHLDTLALVANGTRYQATKLRTNQIESTRKSAIRKPSVASNEINYYFKTGALYVMPEQAGIVVDFMYYKQVPAATIVLTPTSNQNSDFVTPTTTADFGWPTSMFNLLVYMILEQFGIEVKEQLLLEYSQFGITREMIKTNPQ